MIYGLLQIISVDGTLHIEGLFFDLLRSNIQNSEVKWETIENIDKSGGEKMMSKGKLVKM